jgi:hypothetical protein
MQRSPSRAEPADYLNVGRRLGAQCLRLVPVMVIALTASLGVAAQDEVAGDPVGDGVWRLEFSPYTHHYNFDPQHKLVWAVGLEREAPDHSLYGLTAFSNSFGQPSAYGYYGRVYDKVSDRFDSLYLKWTIGVIYGYKAPFGDKIRFNNNGFAPAIIPAVGWRLDNGWSVQVNFLGTAAVMLMVTKRL